jgi:hypothetical protein
MIRLAQAGVIVVNSGPLVMELLRDNAHPKAAEVYGAVGRGPGSSWPSWRDAEKAA